ncbi:sensor histidine kinase [Petroclostridium sp. X23]|uniref:sensor histidine kinase n=1 Tax=Petroclostridium sp. X23 TaxID=3045146 RepID=UPI0024ACB9D2|nr:sensor histidine kinase [Petroclostridium sp. X23]WHH57974.1 sensor histidine kinase [Petroclostridium sp. X23]
MDPVIINFKKWCADLSIARKLMLANMIIVIIPIILAIIANRVSSNVIVDKTINNSYQSLDIIIESMDGLLNDVEGTANVAIKDERILEALKQDAGNKAADPVDYSFIGQTILNKIIETKTIINSMEIYTKDAKMIGAGYIDAHRFESVKGIKQELINQAINNHGMALWLDNTLLTEPLYSPYDQSITMLKTILDPMTQDILGVLKINISGNIFSKVYSRLNYGSAGSFVIINSQGDIVSYDKELGHYKDTIHQNYTEWLTKRGREGKIYKIGNESLLVNLSRINRLDWTIIGIVPLDALMEDSKKIANTIYFASFICILFEILFSIIVSKTLSKPIVQLSKSMDGAAQGDLNVRAKISGNDEVGKLAQTFNKMVLRISQLMDQAYADQKKKRELELLSLQSQINPHFLYNTLESVCSLVQLDRTDDVFDMAKSLGMFYRIALSSGNTVINIDDEIKNVHDYLTIQKIRYCDKLDYKICVGDEILPQKILKLTIQPLVENAIYHGLKNIKGKGSIWIIGKKKDDRIKLSVIDNGIGLTQSQLSDLIIKVNTESDNKSFGLRSVNERIKLYFGNEYGIAIDSIYGKWTKVDVILPYRRM